MCHLPPIGSVFNSVKFLVFLMGFITFLGLFELMFFAYLIIINRCFALLGPRIWLERRGALCAGLS